MKEIMNQFKMGMRLLKYAYGKASSYGLLGIFLILGILIGCLTIELGMISSLMLIIAEMWIMQMMYSFGVSKLIKTSPHAKKIETSMSAIINVVFTTIFYLIIIVIKICWLRGADELQTAYMSIEVILIGFFSIFIMISMATAYKYFVGTMILFCIGCVMSFGISPYEWQKYNLQINFDMPFWQAAVIGFAEILVGALLQYGVSLLIYRRPVSKAAQLSSLAKLM